MAALTDDIGSRVEVLGHVVLGRSRSADLTLNDTQVSAQHAAVRWTREGWTVRDLGSRNGTTVNGQALATGTQHMLGVGDRIVLAGRCAFVFVCDGPPSPMARSATGRVVGSGELLALPSADDPLVLIVNDPVAGWVVLEDDTSTVVADGDTLNVAGQHWILSLPEFGVRTVEARHDALSLDDVALKLRVSADEEFVEATVFLRGEPQVLKPKAHHYLVLTLARARIADADEPLAEQGWVYSDDLTKMLRMSTNLLYVSIHRARKEIEALGVVDASAFIERRTPSKQVRLGLVTADVGGI